jgi:hypothetical protein
VTASVYSGTRYCRRKSRSFARLQWKGAILWCCVLGIAGFFALNLIYQVIRKPGEIFAPVSSSLSKSPASTGRVTGQFSRSVLQALFHLNFSRRWLKSRATGIPSPSPTGAGSGHGTLSKSIVRPQVRSACFKSPTERLPRPGSIASEIIWS